MTFFLFYLSKTVLISGLLYGYYRLFLRDRLFHLYNRFFLLGIPVVALLLPLIPMPSFFTFRGIAYPGAVLHAIRPGDWTESVATQTTPVLRSVELNWQGLVLGGYLLVTCCLALIFIRQLRYIGRLSKVYSGKFIGGIRFYLTREQGTPFSFLTSIFWNEELERDSPRGEQIFRHELYHVRQKHTFDLLFLKPLLIFFWPNLFFYLIYREIRAIHEFLADDHAISGGDRYQYAELLVWQTMGCPAPTLLHPFFHSSIKRRITMIIQNKTTRTGYTSRVMILPLFFFILCAFAVRLDPHRSEAFAERPQAITAAGVGNSPGPLTVVIDAGHGGFDPGAVAGNGTREKDINLALALKVRELSASYPVHVVLTRETDELSGNRSTIRESLEYRTKIASENKADLFVSIHTDATGDGHDDQGFSIYLSHENKHYSQCVRLGSALIETLKGTYTTAEDLKESKQHIYVLRNTEMPSITVLCGNINNTRDFAFITNGNNQEKIARAILEGIQQYQAH